MRVTLSTVSKTVSIMALGLMALSLMTIMPEHEEYFEKFEAFLSDTAQKVASPENRQEIADVSMDSLISRLTDNLILMQNATLGSFFENENYEKLKEKEDVDVQTFVANTEVKRNYMETDEYRQELIQEFEKANEQIGSGMIQDTMQEIDMMKIMKESLPLIETLEKIMPLGMWLGVMHALSMAGIFTMLGLISKPFAIIYGYIADAVIQALSPPAQAQ